MDYKDKYIKYKTKYLELKNKNINYQIGGNYLVDYTIIKTLGKGMHGTVYLVEKNDSKEHFAMKVEQVFERDLEENFKSPICREIDFANTISTKYPKQFMKIFSYENKECGYIHQLDPNRWKTMDSTTKKYYEELFASPFCSIKITSIIDGMLHNIIYNITDKNILYDLFIQVINIAYLINKEGYYHRDMHPKNIGVIYTDDEYINILGKNVPTHGFLLQAIDYGMVIHKKYDLESNEIIQIENDNDLYQNLYKIIFKIMLKNLTEKYPDVDINQIVPISKKNKKELNNYLKQYKIDSTDFFIHRYEYFEELLYKILFFNKFQEQIGISEKVELFDFLSIDDVKFIFINYGNLQNILIYLTSKFIP